MASALSFRVPAVAWSVDSGRLVGGACRAPAWHQQAQDREQTSRRSASASLLGDRPATRRVVQASYRGGRPALVLGTVSLLPPPRAGPCRAPAGLPRAVWAVSPCGLACCSGSQLRPAVPASAGTHGKDGGAFVSSVPGLAGNTSPHVTGAAGKCQPHGPRPRLPQSALAATRNRTGTAVE